MNLRWRLTLFYALVSAFILLIGTVALVLSLRASVYGLLDESLEQATHVVARRFDSPNDQLRLPRDMLLPPRVPSALRNARPRLASDIILNVFNPAGQRIDALDEDVLQIPLVLGRASIDAYRVLTLRTPNGFWIRAARSESDALNTLERTQKGLLIGLPLLLGFGLIAGYGLADRALKPVDAVSTLAARIATNGIPGQRVPESAGNDEMARLTRTVNAMLEKLEALLEQERAFALAAAHELRTPLAVLQARVTLSLERERTSQHYQQALQTVSSTTLDLTRLVEGLLTLARTNTPTQTIPIDLADIALQVTEAHTLAAHAKDQHLELNLTSTPTHGDPAALRLALSNLLRNAIHYAPNHAQIRIRSYFTDTNAILEVSDNGTGVPDAELERLRRPFQRGHGLQAVQGSGLGLALVDAIATQHAGQLKLSRADMGGLQAALFLPRA